MATKVIGVCGVGCVGKTHYCKRLLSEYKEQNKLRPVLLSLGTFFRNALGADFFVKLSGPTAPVATEHWVRNMVHHAITMAYNYKCDVILDGFPRTVLQLEWLMYSSHVSKHDLPVTLRFLQVSQDVLHQRFNLKLVEFPTEKELTKVRLNNDAFVIDSVWSRANVMVNEVPLLEVEDIDYL